MNRIFKYNVFVIFIFFVRFIGLLVFFIILQLRKYFLILRFCKFLIQFNSFFSEDLGLIGFGLFFFFCRKFEGDGEGVGDRNDVNILLISLFCLWLDEEQNEDEKFLLGFVIGRLEFFRELCIFSFSSFVVKFEVVLDFFVYFLFLL